MTSLTSTFDRKWKSLVNPSNILLNNTNVFNEKKDINDDTDSNSKKTICTAEVFRDPSLHRSVGEMSHQNRKRNVSFCANIIFIKSILINLINYVFNFMISGLIG